MNEVEKIINEYGNKVAEATVRFVTRKYTEKKRDRLWLSYAFKATHKLTNLIQKKEREVYERASRDLAKEFKSKVAKEAVEGFQEWLRVDMHRPDCSNEGYAEQYLKEIDK